MGGFVEDQYGKRYLIACAHVLRGDAGTPIVMSGSKTVVATLATASELTLGKQNGLRNRADCALGLLNPSVEIRPGLDFAPIPGFSSAVPGMEVLLLGSSAPSGVVLSAESTVQVNFPFGSYWFANQILVRPANGASNFALPGDSGSLVVVKETNQAVGIVFATGLKAREPSSGRLITVSAVCPIDAVFESFLPLELKFIH